MTDVVSKLWGFCNTLRHDGIDYGDYIEQITYLLFLKMADERAVGLPDKCDWTHLKALSGTDLTDEYPTMLRELGRQSGILGDIFAGAQSRFTNPVNLRRLITLIDETEWTSLDVDVKAEAFEGLLEKAASEGKKGAGQYFTPRLLIQSMMRCIKPDPRVKADFTIGDPACGTGGFLVAAYEWLKDELKQEKVAPDRETQKHIRERTYFGQELVARPRRLALMNLYLHNVTPHIARGDSIYEVYNGPKFDVVITNPPFGNKGANQVPEREDFTVATSNKQLNFIQHIQTILKPGGRAAVVVPDNVLFADQAGEVFRILTQDCDLHTVIRLPRGTFTPYTPGTKTYVIFFTKGRPTERVWLYDARANVPGITKKDRPLTPAHFEDFERCFGDDPFGRSPRIETDRFRSFSFDEIKGRDFKLDSFKWIKDETTDDTDDLGEPDDLISDALSHLSTAMGELAALQEVLATISPTQRLSDTQPAQDELDTWPMVTLGDVCQINPPKPRPDALNEDALVTFVPMSAVDDITGAIVAPEERTFAKVRGSYTAFRDGDVIFAKITPCMENGKAAIASGLTNGLGFGSSEFHVLRPNELVRPEFVYHLVRQKSFRAEARENMTGSVGQARVPAGWLKDHAFALPPIEEQLAIVKQLEDVGTRIQAASDCIPQALSFIDRAAQVIVSKALRGELII